MLTPTYPRLRGAEFFSVADIPLSVFRLSSEHSGRHSHDFHELVLVTRGTARHELFLPDGDCHEISALAQGDLISVPLGWSHCYIEAKQLEIFNILFAPQLLDQWQQAVEGFSIFEDSASKPTRWSLQRGEFEHLETLLQTITRELVGRKRGFELSAQAKLAEVLVWVERLNSRSNESRNPESDLAISGAIAFMEQHFAEPITLDEIARTAHLSPNYFCEVFKNATGQPPGRYLLRLRLEHARYLVLSTTQPMTQVALEAGFADASYFARAFKAAFGTAPSRLRVTGR